MITSSPDDKYKKIKTFLIGLVTVALIVVIVLLIKNCHDRAYERKMIEYYRQEAFKILEPAWTHYITHENFEGDWWSEKFKHPKMIQEDGRPLAFMDGVDQDVDGISDIKWNDPNIPYEILVVSESASYALLRAVFMKDKKTFDKVWTWTKQHLQHSEIKYVYQWKNVNHSDNGWRTLEELGIERDHLFAWRWTPTIADRDGDGRAEDGIIYYRWQQPTEEDNPNDPWRDGWDAASDADEDIALALIFAHSLWGSKEGDKYLNYAKNARLILKDLWNKETYIHKEHRYLAGGDNIKAIEPGYLSPFSYRIFDDFDSERNWMDLVDSSYRIFNLSSIAVLSDWIDRTGEVHNQNPYKRKGSIRANLLPDWVNLDRDGGIIDGIEREEPEFGTDAFRALWRIALDYAWFKDHRAAEYIKQHSPYGPYDFFYQQMHDKKGNWKKTKNYDESERIASTYWHDGSYTLYESNYEPPADIPNRVENANDSRANCSQYAVYLSYFWSSYMLKPSRKSFNMIEKIVSPLITFDKDGFSKREYIIPEDQLANETPANIAKNTPQDKIDPQDDIGTPYNDGDGWLCKDSDGLYWTIFDHSEWNGQMDYFSNSWAWLGLGFFAGKVKNFYKTQNDQPEISEFFVYLDKNYQFKAKDYINTEAYYVQAKGEDKNPQHRDFFYMDVETTQKDSKPISLKMVETTKDSGVYRSVGYIGLESSDAADRVAGSVGKHIIFTVRKKPKLRKKYLIGKIILTEVIEDFENGSAFDANPLAWWTDALKPSSGKPKFTVGKDKGIYVWKDKEWHIRFLGDSDRQVYHGTILTDGLIQTAKVTSIEKDDSFKKLKKSLNFTFIESDGVDGIDFTVKGKYIIFDIKHNGYYQLGSFFIGANSDSAFGAPLILRNKGDTGSYKLKINKTKAVNSKFSLQINKKFIGKDYPYMGAVIFNEAHQDWSMYDEFTFDVFLSKDIGPIRVDIQDIDGTVVILNGYNPWNDAKGPGWYKWRSNSQFGIDVNADHVQPFSIRYRDWWKGWSFDAGRNVDRTKEIDLSKIRNIMFCIHGGAQDSSKILIDNLTLERINYFYGYNKPKSIRKISLYKDRDYSKPFNLKKKSTQETVYVEVLGKDSSPDTFDKFSLKVETTDEFPGCHDIEFEVLETGENTGVYRGQFKIGVKSDFAHHVIGAAEGHWIQIFSDVRKRLVKKLQIGAFKITNVLDDFDDIAAGKSPESWWIDTIDPSSGMPIYPAGNKLGYFVWKEGNVWKVRWSSDQTEHKFNGNLYTDKEFKIINKYNLEETDHVKLVTPKHIKYDTVETFAEDGFDFKTSGTFVEFSTLIDGLKYAERTWVGPYDWNKAYTIPFTIRNLGKTRSYDLLVSNRHYVSKPNSMQVKKVYFSKDYPYIGKWGLSGDLQKWDDKDEFVMWVYLREDVGNIRVDIEDHNRQTAIVNEYDPYSYEKGAGWYRWSSNYSSGAAMAEGAIDARPIKDRRFWMSYDTLLEKNVDVTNKFRLDNILNLEISVGGGERRDSFVNIDNLVLIRDNKHIGYTNPKEIKDIRLFTDSGYQKEIKEIIEQQNNFVQLEGVDGDPFSQDKTVVEIYTDDKFVKNNKISLLLTETASNTGIYRGTFKIGLQTNDKDDQIGSSWHSNLSFISPVNRSFVKEYPVGIIRLAYVIDDFMDGSIQDKYPVTWWISGAAQEHRSYKLNVVPLQDKRAMEVKKTFMGDYYPYFGAWGLRGEKMNWKNKEDLIMDIYLEKDPGEIRIDIEDQSGHVAVLNGYDPWDAEKGAGWYQWRASKGIGSDVRDNLVDLDMLKNRQWWKGWNKELQQYSDVTGQIDLSKIINMQVAIDPGADQDQQIWIDKIYLVNHNFYVGYSAPKVVDRFNYYYDPSYLVKKTKNGEIIFREQHLEIVGQDEDNYRVDTFPAKLIIWDNNDHYSKKVRFWETDVNSGVYRSDVDLLTIKHPGDERVPTPGNYVSVYLRKSDQSEKVRIKSLLDFDWSILDQLIKDLGIGGKKKGIWPWILLVILILCTSGGYGYYRYRKSKNNPRIPGIPKK